MENKLARLSRTTGGLRFFLPVGIILIVFGIFLLINAPKEYLPVTGTVTNNESYLEDGSTLYNVYFSYNVDGKTYENYFSDFTEAQEIGSEIQLYYDATNPNAISNTKNSRLIAVIMIVVGLAAAAFAVYSLIRNVKKNKAIDEQTKLAGGTGETQDVTPLPKQSLTEYYVLFDGNSLKPGYLVEDKNRNVIYTAAMTKNAAIGDRTFTFTDRTLGRTTEHAVGHTITQSFENDFFSTSSYFKFDGKNIWDLLHEKGVRIKTDLRSQFPKTVFTVSRGGRFFATIETSSKYVHEEDEAQHKVKIPVGRYYYRCWTNERDIDLLFLTVFAISETEQAVVE